MPPTITALSTELLLEIARFVYDDGCDHFSLTQLSQVDHQIHFICQEILFERAWLPLFTSQENSLHALHFFTARSNISRHIQTLVIPLGARTEPICDEELELLETFFQDLPRLKEISIGGNKYNYIYNPIMESAIPSVLAAICHRRDTSSPLRLSIDWNGHSLADFVSKSSKKQWELPSLTLCPLKRLPPSSSQPTSFSELQISEMTINDFKRAVQYDPELRSLHIALVNFKVESNHRQTRSPHNLNTARNILEEIGRAASDTKIDSLEIEGVWSFQFTSSTNMDFFPMWRPCFERLRSLTISEFDAWVMLFRPLSPKAVIFESLEEFRLSLNCNDHRLYSPGSGGGCNWDPRRADFVTEFVETYSLRHLTLCGIGREDIFQCAWRSGKTLRSLRLHISVQSECALLGLQAEDLMRINAMAPHLEWLGFDFPVIPPQGARWQDQPTYVPFSPFLEPLTNFASLRELSAFVEARQGTTVNITNSQIVQTFSFLETYKEGCPFEKLTVTCINHVWTVTTPSPSRAVLRSFCRDRPEEGYTIELWDTRSRVPVRVEMGVLGPPPIYEFGLSKRDLECKIVRPLQWSCILGGN